MSEKPPVSRNMRIAQWSIPVLLLAILGINSFGPIQQQLRAVEKVRAISNFKQIFVALSSYANDHDGLYPDDSENESATAATCLNKLLKAEKIDAEECFWNKKNAQIIGTASKSSPKNNRSLTENENTTGYVMGLTTSSSTNHPILFDSSTESGVFNTSVWEGKAIVSKLNGSVKALHISKVSNASNQKNEGYILERREGIIVDIFQELPQGSTVLAPQLAR